MKGVTPERRTGLSSAPAVAKVCVGGLVAAAAGVLAQYIALPEDFPTVPPGPIILAAAAAFVALATRWWWSPLVGVGVSLMTLIGGLLSGGVVDNLSESVGPAIGAGVMLIGLGTAIVTGVAATRQAPVSLRRRQLAASPAPRPQFERRTWTDDDCAAVHAVGVPQADRSPDTSAVGRRRVCVNIGHVIEPPPSAPSACPGCAAYGELTDRPRPRPASTSKRSPARPLRTTNRKD